ncbi:unnamed protein product [Brassica rapa subsp. trilocularis]
MGSSACTYSTVHAFTITRMGYTTRALSNTAIAGTLSVSPSHALPFPQLRLTAAGCTANCNINVIILSFIRRYGRFLLTPFLVVHLDFHNLDSSKLYICMPLGSQPGPKVSNFPSHSPMSTILKSQPLRNSQELLHNLVSLEPLRKVWWIHRTAQVKAQHAEGLIWILHTH